MKGGFLRLPEPMTSLIRGLETKAVTNIYGGPGTGKTNLCLIAALECINSGGTVVYIDSEGGFSLERLRQLEPNTERALSRIKLIEPKTFEEQGKIIRELRNEDADLIIVDSMVALYRLEYSEPRNCKANYSKQLMEANRELSRQLSILSTIAREKNIPVLITSHVFSNWDTGEDEIIGGDSIKYWSKTIIHLEKTGRMSERKATIKKHRFIPEGGSVKFVIVNEGIKPSGFKLF
ncbi:MAG TPA: DNA repair and recombination protein RadB [Candidatus Aenigmarchaeota archaeon]|nr:DNA repair and recombination protein RadB [Candidatus Aenigmarchaeota archaeon]